MRTLLALALALALAACGQPRAPVEYRDREFIAHNWSGPEPEAGWASVFVVRAGAPALFGKPADPSVPPMLGEYRRSGSTIVFRPRFPPSVDAVATYRRPGAEPFERWFLFVQPDKAAPPSVKAISPEADVLPENLLKLYVEFSEPMAQGQAYQHLAILDDRGLAVPNPFVEIDQELWDPAGKRLTILFDPGRIKRGVKPNQDIGAPLLVGRRYRFVVRKGWQSAAGAALPADAEKSFTVAASERRPISLTEWRISPPKSGTRDPLVIDFPRPLDSALLADSLHIQLAGEAVVGTVGVGERARRWTFTPKEPWGAGAYALLVETRLEDLAGNRIGRAFDVDTVALPQPRISKSAETLAFSVH